MAGSGRAVPRAVPGHRAWLSAPALAIAATTAPPKTRLWMPVDCPAKAGKSERYTPSTDHDAITPSTAKRKSDRIASGTLGRENRIRVAERVPLTPHPNDHNLTYLQTKRDRMGHELPDLALDHQAEHEGEHA